MRRYEKRHAKHAEYHIKAGVQEEVNETRGPDPCERGDALSDQGGLFPVQALRARPGDVARRYLIDEARKSPLAALEAIANIERDRHLGKEQRCNLQKT